MRKMATVRAIAEIRPIDGADKICSYRVDGWWVVDAIGKYNVNDLVVYVEVDAFVPSEVAPFLTKPGHEPKEFNGVRGERLKTIRLRGQVSQGLLLPLTVLPRSLGFEFAKPDSTAVGEDVSHWLGIVKYEPPMPAQLAGVVRGNFPGFIPKTDQPRIQNLTGELKEWQSNVLFKWEISEKIDGTSMTVYVCDDDTGVCSRNLDLKEDAANSLWKVAIRENLINKLKSTGRNLALQGELIGEGIQGNLYKITGQDFYLFDIYDIDRGEYMTPLERRTFCDTHDIKHVPVIATETVIEEFVQGLLTMAEGKSRLNSSTEREGLVFKCNAFGGPSFKVISNKWLLKNE